jgi:regulator of sigma E protease
MLAISLLVLLHELGHFTFAKLFKVRVTRFYLFFNPQFHIVSTYDTWVRRLFKMKPEVVPTKKDEDGKEQKEYVGTEYGLGWLPLGGYCAIDGMIDETNQKLSEEAHPWEFRTKPVWQRLLIMIGGVLVNFLLALFIYSMILFYWGDTYIPVGEINMKFNEEAKSYGFQDGDVLVGADGKMFKDFSADLYRMISEAHDVEIVRNGKHEHIALPGDLNLLNMLKSEPRFVEPFLPAEIDSVLPGSPAEKIGLEAGNKILSLNGRTIDSHNTLLYELGRLSDQLAVAKTHEDSMKVRTVMLTFKGVQRDTQVSTAAIDGIEVSDSVAHSAYGVFTKQVVLTEDLKLGFMPRLLTSLYKPYTREYGFFESIPAGIKYGWNVLAGYVDDMKYVFSAEGAKSLGGFGAIGSLFPPMWDWYMFWKMTAFLSIILAFMNILPIPALDGGHVLFLLYEAITRRKPSEQFMIRAEYVGFGILILLMVVANLNDILRWLGYM